MVSLYMDVHVDKAITLGLRRRGVDVLTAEEDGSATTVRPRWTIPYCWIEPQLSTV